MRDDFRARYGPWALVAGASEGIGAAYARRIAASGVNVILLARRAEPLRALADEVTANGVEVRTATVDLTSPDLMRALEPTLSGLEVGLLVYNAGAVHGAEMFVRRPVGDALGLVALNCRAVTLLTHALGGAMADRGRGGIILMTSMSASAGSGYTAMYNATKAFDMVLAEGLWMELGQVGVDVLSVVAGLTDTPAMRRSGIIADPGGGYVPMAADDVAREALDALGARGPVFVAGDDNRAGAAHLWPVPRAELVRRMTDGAVALYRTPPLATPGTAGASAG